MRHVFGTALLALSMLCGDALARGSEPPTIPGVRAPGVRRAVPRPAPLRAVPQRGSQRPAPRGIRPRTQEVQRGSRQDAQRGSNRALGGRVTDANIRRPVTRSRDPRATRTPPPRDYRPRPTGRDRTRTSATRSAGSGTSTREFLQRRVDAAGSTAGRTRLDRRGDRQRDSQVRPATTGYRQPTLGPGYADRFPGTGSPIRTRCNYYRPYYSRYHCCYFGFYYAWPVAYAYVPFGFYGGGTSVYIDATGYVADEYVVERYVAQEPADEKTAYEPAAGSAAAERYMREATELFRKKDYPEAARRFRLAAIAAPDSAGPLFALGQALIALENYPYAAKVIRQAVDMEPALLREGGDIGGVFADREEFERVRGQVEDRVANRKDDVHAPFLLGVMQYFSGDPQARETFRGLRVGDPGDAIARKFSEAAEERFRKADELPEIE